MAEAEALGLDAIMAGVRAALAAKHAARERALPLSREVIRLSATGIRATHRDEFDDARRLLDQATALLREIVAVLAGQPDVFYGGPVLDAQKEHAEAALTLALVTGQRLPGPDDLAVEPSAYLNGLGEAVGELRRYLLDSLRDGDLARCERYLRAMDAIYDVLVTVDYPDAVTGGLRRTTDIARGILERTRGDLTVAVRQGDLERRLAELAARLPPATESEVPNRTTLSTDALRRAEFDAYARELIDYPDEAIIYQELGESPQKFALSLRAAFRRANFSATVRIMKGKDEVRAWKEGPLQASSGAARDPDVAGEKRYSAQSATRAPAKSLSH